MSSITRLTRTIFVLASYVRGYRKSWKTSSTSLRRKRPARWGIRRHKKVDLIKELRLQRPLLEQMQAPAPASAKGSVCSADGDDDFDLEIVGPELGLGVSRGASRNDRRPKRRRLLQHDHARPPYYGDYGKEPPSRYVQTDMFRSYQSLRHLWEAKQWIHKVTLKYECRIFVMESHWGL